MRFLHISDLHLGKRLNGFDMEADQWDILNTVCATAEELEADAVIVAGDVFDTSSPDDSSLNLFSGFLSNLSNSGIDCFVISGNHDSESKISYLKDVLSNSGIYVSDPQGDILQRIDYSRGGETVEVYMMPYVRPSVIRRMRPEADVKDCNDAVRYMIENTRMGSGPKVLIAHQLVTDSGTLPEASDSECRKNPSREAVDVSLFEDFDYVALGHLHKCQQIGRSTVVYSGSPLVYSKSEMSREKCCVVADIDADGVKVSYLPLIPMFPVRSIRGYLEEILSDAYSDGVTEDYVFIELLDSEPENALERLRRFYPNILSVDMPNVKRAREHVPDASEAIGDPMELLEELFENVYGSRMSDEQSSLVRKVFAETESEP